MAWERIPKTLNLPSFFLRGLISTVFGM